MREVMYQGQTNSALPVGHRSYRGYWALPPIERINLVKGGIPSELLQQLASDLQVSRTQLCRWLDLSPTALARKTSQRRPLGRLEGERVLGLARLVGEVEQIMSESSDHPDFDAAGWVGEWLVEPQPSLGGLQPVAFVDLADGRALLSTLLRQMQSGVYV